MTDASNSVKKSVLTEAEDIINGQRRQDYGSVTESFENVANLWSECLQRHIAGCAGCAEKLQNEHS